MCRDPALFGTPDYGASAELGISAILLPPTCCNAVRISAIQQLLGHNDVATTMIYTHVLQQGGQGVPSPLDDLGV